MTDLFRCKPLASAISRTACGARWERKIGATCTRCDVGRQHARGALPERWSDGSDIMAAPVTIATMAELRVHLRLIESREPVPLRGKRLDGLTIREHAERLGVYPQIIRSRLNRGLKPEAALTPGSRGVGRHPAREVRIGGQVFSLRGFARMAGVTHDSVRRWLAQGRSPEAILEACE